MNAQISVIIPCYNVVEIIETCLTSLLNQTQPPLEIILVDDGSIDESVKKIVELQKTLPKIRLFKQAHQGPAVARNFAAQQAQGKILVFVDSDMEFDQSFLKDLTNPIVNKRAIGTWSGNEWVKNWDNVWARCWNYNFDRPGRRLTSTNPGQKPVFRAVLKTEFIRVNGFDLIGYTDDWTLGHKLGLQPKTTYAKFFHYNPSTLAAVFSQANWIGKRRYKLGKLGTIVTIIRANAVFSLIIGLFKAIKFRSPLMVIFKLVYDFGIILGALKKLCFGSYY